MKAFSPCRGREHCTEDGSHCRGCGRSHAEIGLTRELMEDLAEACAAFGYGTGEDEAFVRYVAEKALKRKRRREIPDPEPDR
jgi:hypothetical protein